MYMLLGIYNIFVLLITVHLPQYWFVLHKHIGSCLCVLLLCADNELPLPVYYSAVELWIYQPPGRVPTISSYTVNTQTWISFCLLKERNLHAHAQGNWWLRGWGFFFLLSQYCSLTEHIITCIMKGALTKLPFHWILWIVPYECQAVTGYCNPKYTHEKMALLKCFHQQGQLTGMK